MGREQLHNQLSRDIGRLTEAVDNLVDKIDKQNGRLDVVEKKLIKWDIFWGQIGIVVTAIGFSISVVANIIIDFVKSKLNT